jgi:hypothetical protein
MRNLIALRYKRDEWTSNQSRHRVSHDLARDSEMLYVHGTQENVGASHNVALVVGVLLHSAF